MCVNNDFFKVFGFHSLQTVPGNYNLKAHNSVVRGYNIFLIAGYIPLLGMATACMHVLNIFKEKISASTKVAMAVRAIFEALGVGIYCYQSIL